MSALESILKTWEGSEVVLQSGQAYNHYMYGTGGLSIFFAVWCGHCHLAAKVIREAQERLSVSSKKPLRFAAVNSSDKANDSLAAMLGHSEYPSIYVVTPTGRHLLYTGKRGAVEIEKAVLECLRVADQVE